MKLNRNINKVINNMKDSMADLSKTLYGPIL